VAASRLRRIASARRRVPRRWRSGWQMTGSCCTSIWPGDGPGVVHAQFPVPGKVGLPELLTEREIRVPRLLRG